MNWPLLAVNTCSLLCSSASLLGQADPADEPVAASPAYRSDAPLRLREGTRQLSSSELTTLLVGAEIQRVVPPELDWLEPPEQFHRNGTYILYVHRDKLVGRYTIERNSICVQPATQPKTCRYIFVDVKNRYWISKLRSTRDFTLIDVRKIGSTAS